MKTCAVVIASAELYGRLVVANERLNDRGSMPLWVCALAIFWTGVVLHSWLQIGWQFWFLVPGLGMAGLMGCVQWIRHRQRTYFQNTSGPNSRSICNATVSRSIHSSPE